MLVQSRPYVAVSRWALGQRATHADKSKLAAGRDAAGLGESVEFHKEITKNAVAVDCRGRGAIEVSVRVETPGVVVRDNWRRLEHGWDPSGIDHPAATTRANQTGATGDCWILRCISGRRI